MYYNAEDEEQFKGFIDKLKELAKNYPGHYELYIAVKMQRAVFYTDTSTQRKMILVLENMTNEKRDKLVISVTEEKKETEIKINPVSHFSFDETKEIVRKKKKWFNKF